MKMKITFLLLLLFELFIMSCATPAKKNENVKTIFYPIPPEEPRIQFLTSFSSSRDVTGKRSSFETFIVGREEGEKPIVKPYGLAVWQNKMYICDTQLQAIIIIDLEEKDFGYFTPEGKGRLSKPINIAIDIDGTKYIADTGREAVIIFDARNTYSGVLAREGGMKPTDVVIGGERIYITDLQDNNISVWDKMSRVFLFTIPVEDSDEAQLFSPVNLALDKEGNLYVSDIGAFRVQKYDRDGRFVQSFGSLGDAPGQFARPKGIDVDDEGRLYAVDAAFQVVQIFDREGNLLLFFGEPQEDTYILSLPAKVRINKSLLPYFKDYAAPSFELEYLIFVTSQYGSHKVSVFGFGRERR